MKAFGQSLCSRVEALPADKRDKYQATVDLDKVKEKRTNFIVISVIWFIMLTILLFATDFDTFIALYLFIVVPYAAGPFFYIQSLHRRQTENEAVISRPRT